MKTEILKVSANVVEMKVTLQFFAEEDRYTLKRLFTLWNALNEGMKLIPSGGINLSEGISESAFCLDFNKNTGRASKGGSFYAYDRVEKKAIQIKASSVKYDLPSFGSKSYWEELYFLNFYREETEMKEVM